MKINHIRRWWSARMITGQMQALFLLFLLLYVKTWLTQHHEIPTMYLPILLLGLCQIEKFIWIFQRSELRSCNLHWSLELDNVSSWNVCFIFINKGARISLSTPFLLLWFYVRLLNSNQSTIFHFKKNPSKLFPIEQAKYTIMLHQA